MHHTFDPDHVVAESRRLVEKPNIRLTVDCLFYEDKLLNCERNDIAWFDILKCIGVPFYLLFLPFLFFLFFLSQVSSRNDIHNCECDCDNLHQNSDQIFVCIRPHSYDHLFVKRVIGLPTLDIKC